MISFAIAFLAGVAVTIVAALYLAPEEEELLSLDTDASYQDRVEAVFVTAGILGVPIELKEEDRDNDEVAKESS